MIFDLILIIIFGVIMAKRIESNKKRNTDNMGISDKELEKRLFPKSGEKNKDIKRYLAFAGPLSAKNFSSCNKFRSSKIMTLEKEAIKRDWGIENREDFFEQIEELLYDDIYYYDVIIPVINKNDSSYIYNYLLDKGCNREYAQRYSEVVPQITQNFNTLKIQVPDKTFIAWNFVRAAFLALSAEAAGYIERKESMKILEKVSIKANEYYCDWIEYTASFLYGRKLWIAGTGGYGEDAAEIDEDYKAIICFLYSESGVCSNIAFSNNSFRYEGEVN